MSQRPTAAGAEPGPTLGVRALASLREAPATVPALAAIVLFIVWGSDHAGYPVTHWSPGGLIILVLLLMGIGIIGLRLSEIPLAVRVSLACLAAYTALSYLSILWANVAGDAWEGANRTLVYLLVFALFACWRQRGPTAALLLLCWTSAMIVLAAYAALHLNAAGTTGLDAIFPEGRLNYPSGYPNANAAQWLMAFWPALLMARSERLPAALRGFLAGGAVLLADVALLSQSRGSIYATPVMIILVLAFLPGRMRSLGMLVAVAAGVGVTAPTILKVGDQLAGEQVRSSLVHHAVLASFLAAVAVGLVIALYAALSSRVPLTESSRRRVSVALRALVAVGVVAGVVLALVLAGNPERRISNAWHSFKGGYASTTGSGGRLASGLGSNRYDFYRVALDEFVAHPVAGIGVDNFQQQYLLHGRSQETPRYPHSLEIRTLVETGLIGALLAVVGLGAALLAGWRAVRGTDGLGREVAAAALAGFGYWAVHGSFDWFWEFAGLGAPAFAMLGLACALAPRSDTVAAAAAERPAERSRASRAALFVAGAAVALIAAASLAAPWLSELEVQSATRVWERSPSTAYSRLQEAAHLDPLADQPYSIAGSIALREGELARARMDFRAALQRTPGDSYATLELGAIASASSERARSLELLRDAVRLNPRDEVSAQALAAVRAGRVISIPGLNRAILQSAEQIR